MNRVMAALLGFALWAATPLAAQEPESRFFTTSDGYRIHYLTAGTQGSWVVLLHGYTDSARRMWFTTGIAPALAKTHRVVAIDHLNHGQSDRPEQGGVGRVQDVVALMDLLGITRAHIHGYSMGGAMTTTLLYEHPARFITAGFGGSGFRETDPDLNNLASSFDRSAPEGARGGRAGRGGARSAQPAGGGQAQTGARAGGGLSVFARPLDLTKVTIPVLGINGEFDAPYAKTHRMWRELRIFHNVVLPGLTHFTAIAVGAPMPPQFITSMVGFIDAYDER